MDELEDHSFELGVFNDCFFKENLLNVLNKFLFCCSVVSIY